MNSKQRRKLKRDRLEMVSILSQIADEIESGKMAPSELVEHIREIEQLIKDAMR